MILSRGKCSQDPHSLHTVSRIFRKKISNATCDRTDSIFDWKYIYWERNFDKNGEVGSLGVQSSWHHIFFMTLYAQPNSSIRSAGPCEPDALESWHLKVWRWWKKESELKKEKKEVGGERREKKNDDTEAAKKFIYRPSVRGGCGCGVVVAEVSWGQQPDEKTAVKARGDRQHSGPDGRNARQQLVQFSII